MSQTSEDTCLDARRQLMPIKALIDPLGLVEVAEPKRELSIEYEELYGDPRLSLIRTSRPS
jgi:hypothetical protein